MSEPFKLSRSQAFFSNWRSLVPSTRAFSLKRLGVIVGYLIILGASFGYRMHLVERALPYCRHWDEHVWTQRAAEILQSNDLNPHRNFKPSVMVYLDTVGMALGLVRAGAHGEGIHRPDQLGHHGGFPHYASPTVIGTVRAIYALLSVVAMLVGALCTRWLTKSDGLGLLSLLLMTISGQYFEHSWSYLNADVLGACFSVLTVYYALVLAPSRPPFVAACVSGLLVGLTLGTKYNLWCVLVAPLISTLTRPESRRIERTALLIASTVLMFLLTTPYFALDVSNFVAGAAYESRHYNQGLGSPKVEPGLQALSGYLGNLSDQFGPVILVLAAVGLLVLARRDFRAFSIAFSFPFLLMLLMSRQRAFFTRNLLSLHIFVPIAAAIGAHFVYRWGVKMLLHRWHTGSSVRCRLLSATVVAVAMLSTLPWVNMARAFDPRVESRNEVADWILAHADRDTEILIPRRLYFYTRSLRPHRVVLFDGTEFDLSALEREHPEALLLVPKFKQESVQRRIGQQVRGRRILARFGRRPIDLHYRGREPVPPVLEHGDPVISVIRL